MITCHLMGGLGNQLFQIFATISYAIKLQKPFGFLNLYKLGNVRHTFWHSFLSELKPFLFETLPHVFVVKELAFDYNELPRNVPYNNVLINGYFQSYKYFHDHYEFIYKLLSIDSFKQNLLKKLGYNQSQLDNTISIHFRLGDYKHLQHIHPIMRVQYYYRSIKFIKDKFPDTKFTIMYFCEEKDVELVSIQINYLKGEFNTFDFVRGGQELEDWEQMLLMSVCHHNIIANSTFSWWAAYFNRHEDKVVCYPSSWFGESATHNTKDLCPPEWSKILA